MRRREFIGLIGVAATCPLVAHAQPKMPLIGFLSGRSRAETTAVMGQFYKALAEAGFAEDRICGSNTVGPKVNMSACQP